MKYSELKDVFTRLTFLLRSFDFDDVHSPGQNLVRLAYAKESQPFQKITDGVSYLWVNYADSRTNKIVNQQYVQKHTDKITIVKSNLRSIDVHWIFYGDTAQDLCYDFRQMIFSYKAKELLDKYGIALIPDTVQEGVLIYEQINNIYWPRMELVVTYYTESIFEEDVEMISAVNVTLKTETDEYIINVKEEGGI